MNSIAEMRPRHFCFCKSVNVGATHAAVRERQAERGKDVVEREGARKVEEVTTREAEIIHTLIEREWQKER